MPRPVSLLMIVLLYCTRSRGMRMQSHYKTASASYGTGWQTGRCTLTLKSVKWSGSQTRVKLSWQCTPSTMSNWNKWREQSTWVSPSSTRCPGMPTLTSSPRRQTTPLPSCKETKRPVIDTCYKTFVRHQVEYGATVWDPHKANNIKKVESVQWRAARFVTGNYRYTSSVTAMIIDLAWESLPHIRQQAKAIMMYYIVTMVHVAIPASQHHQILGAATRGHQYKYRESHTVVSFFPSGIRLWNQLPEELTVAGSLEVFKAGICKNHNIRKCTFRHLHPTKTQISLCIHVVWSDQNFQCLHKETLHP